MTKYYIDTEFIEGTQKEFIGRSKPTIDLISIALVSETGREYYAVSNEFNIHEAWHRWEQRTGAGDRNYLNPIHYWIRENVLHAIWKDLMIKNKLAEPEELPFIQMTYKYFKSLIEKYGKPNIQIANEIVAFIYGEQDSVSVLSPLEESRKYEVFDKNLLPIFYGYYADYDWVVFCWLFGKMKDLPNGFPKYCRDLKQLLDEKLEDKTMTFLPSHGKETEVISNSNLDLESKLKWVKSLPNYPKNTGEHHALPDAHWNKKLHEFINTL